jgi:predicted metal-dependent peptidase
LYNKFHLGEIMSVETTLAKKSTTATPFNAAADTQAREKLITARIGLLLRAGFFGNIATRLKLTNADEWCSTAATDGRHFYYNTDFINKLSIRECEFLFGHEVLHVVYDHMGRRDTRDPMVSNIAADYCVNQDLVDHKIGEKINKVPILLDPQYKGMSFEEVYDHLFKNAKKVNIASLASQMLDQHIDDTEEGDESGKPKLTLEERKAIRDEIKDAILQAVQTCGAGNLPGGVQRLIKDMTESVINWRELLLQQIQTIVKNDYSWRKPSRRAWHMDAILPGMVPGDTIDIAVAIDTSGSIGVEDLRIFLSEINGIMESYDEYNITVWSFDTSVYNVQTFSSDNAKSILDYVPEGGGGTDFQANWNYMRNNHIEPKKLVVFTDGYPYGSWGDPDYCDTVWIIHGNPTAKPPFGTWAHYEMAKK